MEKPSEPKATEQLRKAVKETVEEAERVAEEIRVRIHLAGMDAKSAWRSLEPEIDKLRDQARSTTEATRVAAHQLLDRLKDLRSKL